LTDDLTQQLATQLSKALDYIELRIKTDLVNDIAPRIAVDEDELMQTGIPELKSMRDTLSNLRPSFNAGNRIISNISIRHSVPLLVLIIFEVCREKW